MVIESSGTPLLYGGFLLLVVVLLTVDFAVLKTQGNHRVSVKEAALWSVVWVTIALAFGGWLWWYLNGRFGAEVAWEKSMEYLAGYLIEKSLAVDNVFVWITLFGFFSVPVQYQKRVLLYGVLGAIVLRGILIYVGALLLATFHRSLKSRKIPCFGLSVDFSRSPTITKMNIFLSSTTASAMPLRSSLS
jgi:tellurite resistance protein TerC